MVQSCESLAHHEGWTEVSTRPKPLLLALKQACTIAKGLFDALKVVPLPALPRPLLLGSRDAAAFHAQLCLSILVNEGQGDGSEMPYGKGVSDPEFLDGHTPGDNSVWGPGQQALLTLWPRLKPPLHSNVFLRDLE